ncbi:hypothetical protein KDX27_42190 [Burkholderia cenocepacia]|uniref:hypothetical protein n=1 Tax=Burkholderia cepacia complex TaxID=87882 RepID=UPI001B9681F4|nr:MULTISPECIES: hypothetical protein [Burkholderia cepacia complex]MBR8030374.1 hypothetical protein [Burkholderia cenocepacia]MBR8174275.1 hypothetical protein [Burkholderia cenocepacia]MBU9633639.1 hypothetical protein [Burkholderia multivorans]MBU9633649.1 hypothetical protein [Burkholderia multivorans]
MNNTMYWLEQVEKESKLQGSNPQLAQLLGVTRSSISHQKRGVYAMGVRSAVAAAYVLEIHPMLIVASTQYDSATNDDDRIFWLTTYMKWADKAPANIRPPITEVIRPDEDR